jgi:hypothetical protein
MTGPFGSFGTPSVTVKRNSFESRNAVTPPRMKRRSPATISSISGCGERVLRKKARAVFRDEAFDISDETIDLSKID